MCLFGSRLQSSSSMHQANSGLQTTKHWARNGRRWEWLPNIHLLQKTAAWLPSIHHWKRDWRGWTRMSHLRLPTTLLETDSGLQTTQLRAGDWRGWEWLPQIHLLHEASSRLQTASGRRRSRWRWKRMPQISLSMNRSTGSNFKQKDPNGRLYGRIVILNVTEYPRRIICHLPFPSPFILIRSF